MPIQTIKLGPDGQDVWITNTFSYNDNFGVDNQELRVGGFGDLYYSLIKFNLIGAGLPALVTSAKLRLYNNANEGSPTGVFVDQVQTTWSENTGWFDSPPLRYSNIGAVNVQSNGWIEIDITSSVNAWLASPSSNNGIQLRPFLNSNNFDEFVSSDATGTLAEFRPELVVQWSDAPSPTGGVIATLNTAQQLELVYLSYFNRAADPSGYIFWGNQNIKAQASGQQADLALSNIANSFTPQPETLSLYPFLSTTALDPTSPIVQAGLNTLVDNVYFNLFERAPEPAGKAYWTHQLLTGAIPLGSAVLAIANGANGSDAVTLTNKIQSALSTTQSHIVNLNSDNLFFAGAFAPTIGQIGSGATYFVAHDLNAFGFRISNVLSPQGGFWHDVSANFANAIDGPHSLTPLSFDPAIGPAVTTIRVERSDGGSFALASLDLDSQIIGLSLFVTVHGQKFDGSQISELVEVNNSAGLQTFLLSDRFTNLKYADISSGPLLFAGDTFNHIAQPFIFDNITLLV